MPSPLAILALGVLLFGLGYLVRVHRMTGLLTGLTFAIAAGPDRAADVMGGALFVLAAVTVAYAGAIWLGFTGALAADAYGILIVAIMLATTVQSARPA